MSVQIVPLTSFACYLPCEDIIHCDKKKKKCCKKYKKKGKSACKKCPRF